MCPGIVRWLYMTYKKTPAFWHRQPLFFGLLFFLYFYFLFLLFAAIVNAIIIFNDWDPSPQVRLIEVSDPIQFPGILPTYQDERMDNYLPEGILFGDGRILWVKYFYDVKTIKRRIMEDYLSGDEIKGLLQHFSQTGFFDWKDSYSGPFQEDGPPNKTITVCLKENIKTVVVNSATAPQGYHELYELISSGGGAGGHEYVPELAFLSAYPQYFDWDEDEGIQINRWPAAEMGGAYPGKYITGQILAFAWQLINADPGSPLVEDGGEIYLITLQIPGLSMYPLPDPWESF